MREEEETATESHKNTGIRTLKKLQKRVSDMDDSTGDVGLVGCSFFLMWAGCFFGLNVFYKWSGILSAFLWSGVYWLGGTFAGLIAGLLLSNLGKHWIFTALGYISILAGLAMILMHHYNLDPSINIVLHSVLSLLVLIFSYKGIQKKNEENQNLRISPELQNLIKEYDISELDSTLSTQLDEAVHDRMDVHQKIYLIQNQDTLLKEAGILEEIDEAICNLMIQANTIMQFREREARFTKEEPQDAQESQSKAHLTDKLQSLEAQFEQKKTALHELTLDILSIDNDQISKGIAAIQQKRSEIALIEKTRKEID